MIRSLFLAMLFLVGAAPLLAQRICGLGELEHPCAHEGCQLTADPEDKFTFIPPPSNFVFGEARAASITVNYTGFTTAAQTAFAYAVDIWSANITSSETIVIDANFTTLGTGVLGSAGPTNIQRNFSGAPVTGVWFPGPLANSIAETDLSPTQADISCFFNDSFGWYYGTDGNCPGGLYDFVSVVLHELGHGLGFVGSASYVSGNGFYGSGSNPYIYDTFVETGAGIGITSFTSGSTALGSELIGGDLWWNGANAMANNGGNRPRIYAPGGWNGGSSFSHLNEGTYPSGTINSLMTPQIGSAEAIHDPGPITYGMFQDMAWQVGGCAITDISVSTQFACNPVNNAYTQQLIITYENAPSSGFININGNIFPVFQSPQLITMNLLPADGAPVDLDVFFTDFPTCTYTELNAFTAPPSCCAIVRLENVDPGTGDLTLKNWGSCDVDVSNYILSASLNEEIASNMALVTGDLVLSENETVTLNWATLAGLGAGSDLALYNPFADLANMSDLLDFVQWGSGGNGREAVAAGAGLWSAGEFLDGLAPYMFEGGVADYGLAFWGVTPPPCSIDNLLAGVQLACDPETDSYSQEVVVYYTSPPASGQLNVNGQVVDFVGATSQGLFLTGLPSDGMGVDVTAFFTAEPGCATTVSTLFTASESCINTCPVDLSGDDTIDIQDLLMVLGDFGCLALCLGDVNGDGKTDSTDVLDVIALLGTTCP